MNKEFIDFAYKFVSEFRSYDLRTKSIKKIDFDYCVPSIRGISKFEWGKDIDSVKPSTLEYIIFYLHNAEPKMIEDAIISLFYYWKVRKQNRKMMQKVYQKILEHYTRVNNIGEIPRTSTKDADAWLNHNEYVIYSVGFCIGCLKVNKFGYTSDKNRFKKLISDVKAKYPHVSVGSFEVYQELEFFNEEIVKEFEEEALSNMVLHPHYKKCKCCFDGYKESYLDIDYYQAT
ncbi:hypothetical protein [Arcobacter arenosus]|uniref:hypothetical protein n=1 Tax=Arcobacter arenosus TaxID=2576037 RepID=UPI003BAC10F5